MKTVNNILILTTMISFLVSWQEFANAGPYKLRLELKSDMAFVPYYIDESGKAFPSTERYMKGNHVNATFVPTLINGESMSEEDIIEGIQEDDVFRSCFHFANAEIEGFLNRLGDSWQTPVVTPAVESLERVVARTERGAVKVEGKAEFIRYEREVDFGQSPEDGLVEMEPDQSHATMKLPLRVQAGSDCTMEGMLEVDLRTDQEIGLMHRLQAEWRAIKSMRTNERLVSELYRMFPGAGRTEHVFSETVSINRGAAELGHYGEIGPHHISRKAFLTGSPRIVKTVLREIASSVPVRAADQDGKSAY